MTLPKSVTTKIIKDLVRLDHMDSLHVIDSTTIFFLTRKVQLMGEITANDVDRIGNLERVIALSEEQSALCKEQQSVLKKQLRKEKRKKFIVGGVGIVAIVLLIL